LIEKLVDFIMYVAVSALFIRGLVADSKVRGLGQSAQPARIPIAKGESFPPCASCNTGPEWQLIVSA